jgi:hypothetical protein
MLSEVPSPEPSLDVRQRGWRQQPLQDNNDRMVCRWNFDWRREAEKRV